MAQARSQSAIEYLMTYGWSILIIAVVIAALFALGIFNSNSAGGATSCIALSGYQCSSVSLSSAGYLSSTIGEIGLGTITISESGCTTSSTQPTMVPLTASITISSSQSATVPFSCFSSSQPVGTKFTGYLWVGYTPAGSTITDVIRVANVKATVTNSSAQSSFGIRAYVPITVTNANTVIGTGSSFQQMVSFNPAQAAYSANESSDLGNIRFTQGGSVLYSWCESGCNSIGGSNAIFWVLIPGGISTNGNVVLNMIFLSNSVEYDGAFAGECPTCSSSYAKYDNGANVFSNYWDFSGTSVPSGWTILSTGTAVSNGFTIAPLNYMETTSPYSIGAITEAYVSSVSFGSTTPNAGMSMSVDQFGNQYTNTGQYINCVNGAGCFYNGILTQFSTSSNDLMASFLNGVNTASSTASWSIPSIWGITAQSSSAQFYINYAAPLTTSAHIPAQGNYYIFFGASTSASTFKVNWVRARVYPPGGVMPSTSFGSILP